MGQEQIRVEMVVRSADEKHRSLRVKATAFGPSTWMTQRLCESIVLDDPRDSRSAETLEARNDTRRSHQV
jgi:hypothetical protein